MFTKKLSDLTTWQWLLIIFVIGPILTGVIRLILQQVDKNRKEKEAKTVVIATV